VLAICVMNYIYKATMAIVLTPVIYLVEGRIEKYIGHDVAMRMKKAAMGEPDDAFKNIPAAG
jgi:queuosine precursor transporter